MCLQDHSSNRNELIGNGGCGRVHPAAMLAVYEHKERRRSSMLRRDLPQLLVVAFFHDPSGRSRCQSERTIGLKFTRRLDEIGWLELLGTYVHLHCVAQLLGFYSACTGIRCINSKSCTWLHIQTPLSSWLDSDLCCMYFYLTKRESPMFKPCMAQCQIVKIT